MVKLLVGLLKGGVIGGAVGYGAFALADATGFGNAWLTYGVVGMLVGLFVGRPLWSLIRDKSSTTWIGVIKGAVGFGIGCGLYALLAKAINPGSLEVGGYNLFGWPPYVGAMIGGIYGAFVEIDDSVGADDKGKDKSAPVRAPKQLGK